TCSIVFFFSCSHPAPRQLPSFPTRRSSDLPRQPRRLAGHEAAVAAVAIFADGRHAVSGSDDGTVGYWDLAMGGPIARWQGHRGKIGRAHAELQSRENLVCRLLLEKKKKIKK